MSFLTVLIKPLAYVSLPIFLLRSIATSFPRARYPIRLVLFYSSVGLCAVWGMVVAVGMSLIGRPLDVNWVVARSFYIFGSRLFDIKFTLEGEEHLQNRPAILIGNHQSVLDILFIARFFPKRISMSAKKELRWTPGLGGFLLLSGAIFVDRRDKARAISSLQEAGSFLKANNSSLWMFPEGTRSVREHHDLLPFKKGAFHAAIQAGIPIIPVVCENQWKLFRKGVFESGVLRIRVLPPIPTAALTTADVTELSIQTRELMIATLNEISNPVADTIDTQSPPPTKQVQETTELTDLTQHRNQPSPIDIKSEQDGAESSSATPEGSVVSSRIEGSENGVETEEDEGMVLVGRPERA